MFQGAREGRERGDVGLKKSSFIQGNFSTVLVRLIVNYSRESVCVLCVYNTKKCDVKIQKSNMVILNKQYFIQIPIVKIKY